VLGWVARDGIQESREACGGHGYLKVAGIGTIRNDHDANLTYEGDNNVILQQTSNYLLGLLQAKHSGTKTVSPYGSATFINNIDAILKQKWTARGVEDACKPEAILGAYKWLVSYMLQDSARKLNDDLSKGKDQFAAKNDCQVYYLRTLSMVYLENAAIQMFDEFIKSEEVPSSLVPILHKILVLYGLWSMDKHLTIFYQGGYFADRKAAEHVREGLLRSCGALKDDAVSLVDVIAAPDFLINSVLGKSDGELYKNLMAALIHGPGAMGRPDHWKQIVNRPVPNSITSKL
jgi:acyl-CoA oxidase